MNKTIAVVTGASSGMGREFVRQLDTCTRTLEEVWVIARREDRLKALQEEVQHLNLRILALDICKQEDLDSLEKLLEEEQPRVRLLINSAGMGKAGKFAEITRKQAENMVLLNDVALVSITHMVLPYMKEKSNIIQMASAAGFFPQRGFAVYAASKAFVLRFARALHFELKDKGIRVTVVCPGPVDTEFLEISNGVGIKNPLKEFTMVCPDVVVSKALRDAKKGKGISVYGLPMKAVHVAGKLLPSSVVLSILGLLQDQ
ncbi:MAG: SDR family NAD(P)-dependent oxidoreductase [Clostridium sp.]|nr:SDR family NAD(P)-dependent oxidoreductase [Clostridium sp.]